MEINVALEGMCFGKECGTAWNVLERNATLEGMRIERNVVQVECLVERNMA